ncbi:hypothetical protein GCM10023403_00720 [Pseudonocardia benzenivorans]|nr:hypothetical protein PSD17_18600 [Pseudonocardia sp. D17]
MTVHVVVRREDSWPTDTVIIVAGTQALGSEGGDPVRLVWPRGCAKLGAAERAVAWPWAPRPRPLVGSRGDHRYRDTGAVDGAEVPGMVIIAAVGTRRGSWQSGSVHRG